MHWRNSKFQVVYFILGKTHTPDEAYRVLCELREERELALATVRAADFRTQAKLTAAQEVLGSKATKVEKLNAQADIAEIEAYAKNGQACIDEAQRELDFLNLLIERLQPHRQYKDLPDHEAHQLAQKDQWKYELITRAENYVVTQGTIPADHYGTMRLHPDYTSDIAPRIAKLVEAVRSKGLLQAGEIETPMQPVLLNMSKDIKLLS